MMVVPRDAGGELAAALAADVDRAFERFVLTYRDQMVSFVGRMLRDDARAEDVAQDVFVRAYGALKSYAPQRRAELRLPAWLYAIAHNLTRNAVRDGPPAAESLEWHDGEPRAALTDVRWSPEESAAARERWEKLAHAVDALSPRLRPAFVMRYVEDLAYDDIAAALGQPVGTVKASAHRARAAVRALLEDDDV